MPLEFRRNFRVRFYECDPFGHLNNVSYLRYMQETAFDASAAAGYDQARYQELKHSWLIRETDIEYLKPLQFNDEVEVKTWVADFHRVRSKRAYEFRTLESSELVAKASTDWVYMDDFNGAPARVPEYIAKAFYPEGLPASFPPRKPFPKAPPPPHGVFEIHRRVTWADLDPAQHVNNSVYMGYIEECGMQVIAAHGWPVTRMLSEGFALLIRRHQIEYLSQAKLDDELLIQTWASDVRRSTATRHYQITRASDDKPVANVNSLGVWVDLSSGRPIRIPENLLLDFAPNIV